MNCNLLDLICGGLDAGPQAAALSEALFWRYPKKMGINLVIHVITIFFLQAVHGFGIAKGLMKTKSRHDLSMMSTGSKLDTILGLVPVCLEATSSTTTQNDPTAGMTPDEITNYISNVGGGMCGYPEVVRTGVGLGLNLSLFIFGLSHCGLSYFRSLEFCARAVGRRLHQKIA